MVVYKSEIPRPHRGQLPEQSKRRIGEYIKNDNEPIMVDTDDEGSLPRPPTTDGRISATSSFSLSSPSFHSKLTPITSSAYDKSMNPQLSPIVQEKLSCFTSGAQKSMLHSSPNHPMMKNDHHRAINYGKIENLGPSINQLNYTLLLSYRWLNHFNLAINQLSATGDTRPIKLMMVQVEDVPESHLDCRHQIDESTPLHHLYIDRSAFVASDQDTNTECECADDATCQLTSALRFINGLTTLYRDITVATLTNAPQVNRKIPSPTISGSSLLPSPISPMYLTPIDGHAASEVLSLMFVPCCATYDALIDNIRLLESVTQSCYRDDPVESYLLNPEGRDILPSGDCTLPSHAVLDPRMPWNGAMWMPHDRMTPSPLPPAFRTMLESHLNAMMSQTSYESPACQLIASCSYHGSCSHYFLSAQSIPDDCVGFVVQQEETIKSLKWSLSEKNHELSLEIDENERLRQRLQSKIKELEISHTSRKFEMSRRKSLRVENFDLKRLCHHYEELLTDLRSLIFDQSMHHSQELRQLSKFVQLEIGDKNANCIAEGATKSSSQNTTAEEETCDNEWQYDKEQVKVLLNDWTNSQDELEIPSASLRVVAEFDSVVDFAAEQIDRFRTAYQLDQLHHHVSHHQSVASIVPESCHGAATFSVSGESQPGYDHAPPPRSLPLIEDPGPHFGLSYRRMISKNITPNQPVSQNAYATVNAFPNNASIHPPYDYDDPIMSKSSSQAKLISILEDRGNEVEVQYPRNPLPAASLGPIDGNDEQSEIISYLVRKVRRQNLLLESTLSHSSLNVEGNTMIQMATSLSMISWKLLKHLGERLIDLAAIENREPTKKSKNRYFFHSKKTNEGTYDAMEEKESLLKILHRTLSRLFPKSEDVTHLLLHNLEFPKKRPYPCDSVKDIISEFWDVLAYFSGAHPISPKPSTLYRTLLGDSLSASLYKTLISTIGPVDDEGEEELHIKEFWPQPSTTPIDMAMFYDTGIDGVAQLPTINVSDPEPRQSDNSSKYSIFHRLPQINIGRGVAR